VNDSSLRNEDTHFDTCEGQTRVCSSIGKGSIRIPGAHGVTCFHTWLPLWTTKFWLFQVSLRTGGGGGCYQILHATWQPIIQLRLHSPILKDKPLLTLTDLQVFAFHTPITGSLLKKNLVWKAEMASACASSAIAAVAISSPRQVLLTAISNDLINVNLSLFSL
jgi:hypothetical protein